MIDACKAYARAPDARRLAEEDGDDTSSPAVKICTHPQQKGTASWPTSSARRGPVDDLEEGSVDGPFIGSGGAAGRRRRLRRPPDDRADERNYLQFNVFFLFMAIAIGAPRNSRRIRGAMRRNSARLLALPIALPRAAGVACKLWFPPWVPYTVGLLIIGMAAGLLSEFLAANPRCPWHALTYMDADHDGSISRAEYARFKW